MSWLCTQITQTTPDWFDRGVGWPPWHVIGILTALLPSPNIDAHLMPERGGGNVRRTVKKTRSQGLTERAREDSNL